MRAKGFFDFREPKREGGSVINITYDPRKRKWLITRQGRRKAYVAFDVMPTIRVMGRLMKETE